MKLSKTTDINVIEDCRVHFGIQLQSKVLIGRRTKFLTMYNNMLGLDKLNDCGH